MIRQKLFRTILVLPFLFGIAFNATAQEKQASQDEIKKAKKEFDDAIREWKQAAKEALKAWSEFSNCESHEAEEWREKWRVAVDKGNDARDRAADKALVYFIAARGMSEATAAYNIVNVMVRYDLEKGRFDKAYEAAKEMERLRPDHVPSMLDLAVICAKTNRFSEAKEIFDRLIELGRKAYANDPNRFEKYQSDISQRLARLDFYVEEWNKELARREAEKDTNPIVKIQTSRGTIELELFEKQAPETVANFIYLAKDGFYDGLKFHRVMAGFMAQGGCPNGDGSGDPGYSIYDEQFKSDSRIHFRGVISMANIGQPNTGGSQFFLTFSPQPLLDGKHTVFGRITKGESVLEKLRLTHKMNDEKKEVRIEGSVPDKIIKIEVVRDSGKDYQPNKVTKK